MTATLADPIVTTPPLYEREHTDDPGHATHIVMVPPGSPESPQALVLRARIEGFEVEALCGYRWVPHRNPEEYPICTQCYDIYKDSDRDDRDRLPDA